MHRSMFMVLSRQQDGHRDEERNAIEAAKRYQLVPGETLYCEW